MTFIFLIFAQVLLLLIVLFVLGNRMSASSHAVNDRMQEVVSRTQLMGVASLELRDQPGSAGERFAEIIPSVRSLQRLILQSGTDYTAVAVLSVCFAAGAIVLTALSLLNVPLWLALAAAAAVAAVPIMLLSYKRSRRLAQFEEALPESLDMCSRSLRAGYSIVGAWGLIGEQGPAAVKQEFLEAFRKQSFGIPLREALLGMTEKTPSDDLRIVITGILVQKDTGGNLADIIDKVSKLTRERIKIAREVKVQTAQGRLTGWILVLLPVVLAILMNLLNPGYSKVFLEDEVAKNLLIGAFVSLCIGGLVIRHIVRSIEV